MFDKIEEADGLGMVGVLASRSGLERAVLVERSGDFVEVEGIRRALGGKACANSLTCSIALSSRVNLEMG